MKTIKECVMWEGIRRWVISDGNTEDLSGTKTLNVEVHSRFGPLPSHLLRSNQPCQTLEEDAITEQNLCFLACYRPPWCKNSARKHPKWEDFFICSTYSFSFLCRNLPNALLNTETGIASSQHAFPNCSSSGMA